MIKTITSSSNPFIKELIKLKSVKERKNSNSFLVEGKDIVDFCYENNMVKCIISCEEQKDYQCDQIIVPSFILEKISSNKSVPSIMALAFYREDNKPLGNKVVYLDGVQDPGNVGTIIRTALAFGYDDVILSPDSASKYNEKTIVSSKGAIFKIIPHDSITLEHLKELGYYIIVTALKGAIDYKKVDRKEKFVLVLGNEGQGVKEENIAQADVVAKIDIQNIDSLNVGVAGAILMNEYR
ncbi:MAG: TrmH family RNA methyltransferase [Bacilli bacterium]